MSEETKVEAPLPSESQVPLEDIKQQLAEAYLNFLDQQKGGILATGAGLGININPLKKDAVDYLTTEGISSNKKNIFSKFKENLKKKLIEKVTGGTMLAYDKASLNKMKSLIMQNKDDQSKLQALMRQIAEGVDPTLIGLTSKDGLSQKKTNLEYTDKDMRKNVIHSLNAVIEENKKSSIKYLWGGRSDPEKGFDCSGLISYVANQAGLQMSGDSRDMFKRLDSKKLALKENSHEIITDVSDIKEGDLIFRNSTNPEYHRKSGAIPGLEKDGITYRIHHVAFIKDIDVVRGIVSIVESNGAEGVTESQLDVAKELTEKDHKSELYVAHINYDSIEKKQAMPGIV